MCCSHLYWVFQNIFELCARRRCVQGVSLTVKVCTSSLVCNYSPSSSSEVPLMPPLFLDFGVFSPPSLKRYTEGHRKINYSGFSFFRVICPGVGENLLSTELLFQLQCCTASSCCREKWLQHMRKIKIQGAWVYLK